jgi:CelD/BcsL family acetyltransferase involved in cellulose biosynthesis
VVLIWPFALYHDGPWVVARQLGPETSQYSAIVTQDDEGVIERAERAWTFIIENIKCDVVSLPTVREFSVIDRLFRSARSGWSSRVRVPNYWLAREDFPDWDQYQKSRSSRKRLDLSRRRRRFGELGGVVFEASLKGAAYQEVIGWLLDQKLAWLKRTGMQNEWLNSPHYEKFLRAFGSSDAPSGVLLSVLRQNGKLIAVHLGCVGRSSMECLIHTYDPEYSRFSPGMLLIEDVVKWCIDRGLGYDLRIGNEWYKSYFCDHQADTIHYRIARSQFGKIYVARYAMTHAGQRLRAQISGRIPRRVRSILKGSNRVASGH